MVRSWIVAVVSLGILTVAGCASGGSAVPVDGLRGASAKVARAVIESRSGSKLLGEAVFTEVDGGVQVVVQVTGAAPGLHAVHVHDKGDCSAADASSAGGHFNPDSHPHGNPASPDHHAGDLGNIEVGADGTGKLELLARGITVSAGPHSIAARGLVVHDKADDFVTQQPPGNAGSRLGCAVIKAE